MTNTESCKHRHQHVIAKDTIRVQLCLTCGTRVAEWDTRRDRMICEIGNQNTPVENT